MRVGLVYKIIIQCMIILIGLYMCADAVRRNNNVLFINSGKFTYKKSAGVSREAFYDAEEG